MRFPMIPVSEVGVGDEEKILVEILLMVERSYWEFVPKVESGEHIGFQFCFKSFGKNQLPVRDRNSPEYKAWRESVFKRDGYICVECHSPDAPIQADHIKPYSTHPELRTDIDNGQTLCLNCHAKKHPHLGYFARRKTEQNGQIGQI